MKNSTVAQIESSERYKFETTKYLVESLFLTEKIFRDFYLKGIEQTVFTKEPVEVSGKTFASMDNGNNITFTNQLITTTITLHKLLKLLRRRDSRKVIAKMVNRNYKCDRCGEKRKLRFNNTGYCEKHTNCGGYFVCTDNIEQRKRRERNYIKFVESLPKSKEFRNNEENVLTLVSTEILPELFPESPKFKKRAVVEVRFNNGHKNKSGNCFHVTGNVKDEFGNLLCAGSIGETAEKIFPQLKGLSKFHGVPAYPLHFASNLLYLLKSKEWTVEEILNEKLLVNPDETITAENLFDQEWLHNRLRTVVLPELKIQVEKLGLIY